MNLKLSLILSGAAIGAALFLLMNTARASDNPPADPAAAQLAAVGHLDLKNVGPYVEVGTYQILVRSKLGAPNERLPDGTWLYNSFRPDNSAAEGTVVIRFDHGQVSQISLVSPEVAVAMLQARPHPQETVVMASH